jgi:MerR family transcriptional regulator, copper efflux regulator
METDQNSELQPIACTLNGSDQGQRVGEWQNLLAHGTAREPVPDGIRVTLPAELAGPAAELAAAEQQCCPFFRFTLVFDGGDIQLTMQAPPEAAPLLTALTDESAPTASSYPA